MLMAAPLPFRGASSCAFLLALRAGFTPRGKASTRRRRLPPDGAGPIPYQCPRLRPSPRTSPASPPLPCRTRCATAPGWCWRTRLAPSSRGRRTPRWQPGPPACDGRTCRCSVPPSAPAADGRLPHRPRRHGARARRGQLSRRGPPAIHAVAAALAEAAARDASGADLLTPHRRLRGRRAGRPPRACARPRIRTAPGALGAAAAVARLRGHDAPRRARAGGRGEPRPCHQRHGLAPRRLRAQRLCRGGGAERDAGVRPGRAGVTGEPGGIAAVFGQVIGERSTRPPSTASANAGSS